MARTDRPTETTALEHALARAGDGVCVIGGGGDIVLWNRAAEQILGYTAREVMGRPCCAVFAGYDGNGNRLCYRGCHAMTLVKLDEAVQSFDMRTRSKTGQPRWLNVSIVSVAADGPRGPQTIHLFRDVTATKELLGLVHERMTPRALDGRGHEQLSRRELEVLRLMTEGLNTKAVAERLHVSPATVRNHAQNIFGKLGVHSRLEAVAHAVRERLF